MSFYDYKLSQEISARDESFYALLFAMFRKADTDSLEKLKQAFPMKWQEFYARYHAPGGYLEPELSMMRSGDPIWKALNG